MTRLTPLLASACIVVGACDGCSEQPGRPPPLDPSASAVHVDPPTDAAFDAVWKPRTKALSLRDGPAPASSHRYRVAPDCALQYQLRSHRKSEVAPGRPPTDDALDAQLRFAAEDGAYRIHLGSLESTFTADGVSRQQRRDGGLPTAVVKTDGQRWTEVGGPSTLWAAHSAVPALTTFFPPLPGKPVVGSERPWPIETYAVRVTTALPRARVKAGDKRVPDPLPHVDSATVTVSGYVSVGAADAGPATEAAVLEARWRVVDNRSEPTLSQQRESWRGRYLVSDDGRLLYALSMANISSWWSLEPGQSNSKRGSAERELRLVKACDGVVMPAL